MDVQRTRYKYNEMLEKTEVREILDTFARNVVKEAKRKAPKASGDLKNTLTYDVKVNPNSFELFIEGENYLQFIDKGVKGAKDSSKAPRSPYRFTNKMPPLSNIRTWLKRKTGKFRSRNQLSNAFRVQRIVYETGIKTTNFFTKPFEDAYNELPDELIEAYGLDLETFIEFTLKE